MKVLLLKQIHKMTVKIPLTRQRGVCHHLCQLEHLEVRPLERGPSHRRQETPGAEDLLCWQRERWDTFKSEQCDNNWGSVKTNIIWCYLQLSESMNTCSVEPDAECSEEMTLELDTPTTAWTKPWHRSTWEGLEHESILFTRTIHVSFQQQWSSPNRNSW